MILIRKCSCGPCLSFIRYIYVHPPLESNHYKVLGLSHTATQGEIKSAFYELSKKHHPDKNKGCEESAKKFKDITAAYEVLRNEKLRQKYDKEQMLVRQKEYSHTSNNTCDYNYEDERNFYVRTSKNKSKVFYGKTKHFDFDAWNRAHYGPNSYNVYEFSPNNSRPNIKIHFVYKDGHKYQYQDQYQYCYHKHKISHQPRKPIKLVIYFLSGGSAVFFTYKFITNNR